ncbi:reverse transcriptase domain-containing protein [Tanacetum coccineum]
MSRGTPGDNIGSTPADIIGSTSGGPLEVKVKTPRTETTPSTREHIKGHLSALRSLLKEHNERGNVSPIHLILDDVEDRTRVRTVVTGKEIGDADLKKPFKEAVKTPLTRRIIEFAGPEFKMPANIKLYDGTTDLEDHLSRFSSAANFGEWPMPMWCRMFQQTLDGSARGWFENLSQGSIDGKKPSLARSYPKGKCRRHPGGLQDWSAEGKIGSTREDTGLTDEETKKETRLTIGTVELATTKADATLTHEGKPRQLEMALESGKLNHLIKDVRQRGRGNTKGRDVGKDKVINMIRSCPNDRKRKSVERDESWMKASIVFPPLSIEDASDEPLIIEGVIEGYLVRRVYVDQGASVEVMFEHCYENLSPAIRSRLRGTQMDLGGFARGVVRSLGKIELEVVFGDGGLFRTVMINFTVVRAPSPYNVIFGKTGLRSLQAVSSTIHSMEVNQNINQEKEVSERVDLTEQTLVNPTYPNQLVTIGGNLLEQCKNQLKILLKKSMDVFAWEPADMKGIARRVIEHFLNVNPAVEPVAQKRRVMASDRTQVVSKEVEEWVSAGIVRSGYHQVQMAQDDEEKTAFYTYQGTYCYTKMPFGLKNTGATYQRLVDTTFQSQTERNLEAFVDDVVIKSNDEKVLIEDIAETFDNLQRINMKLNPKKCSFGVEEGKFLGYMVTFEEIQANLKKTKAIADMQSPRTLKEMQSLSGKLAALKRFLSRSTEKSLPFFETLKDITKENKDEYRWTESAGKAFQENKKVIVELPLLTTPVKEETLYASGKLAKYLVELGAYNIAYEPKSSMKGQVLANFLSEAPVGTPTEEFFRLPTKLPNKDDMERWTLFTDGASNSKESGADLVLISPSGAEFTYSLRLNFASTNNEAEYEALLAGLRMARKMKLATYAFYHLIKKVLVEVLAERSTDQKEVRAIVEEEEDNWMTLIIRCLADGVCPIDKDERRALRMKINQEIHMGSCEMHIEARSVVAKAIRQGYYWPTMHRDSRNVTQKCDSSQVHAPVPRRPKNVNDINHGSMATLPMGNGHPRAPTPSLQKVEVRHRSHRLLYKIDRSKTVVTDNGTQFVNDPFKGWCESLNIKQMNTAVAHPQANGMVERANKSLMEGIKARLGRDRAGWVDELPNVLWAHRTSLKQSNGETPFSLTYGSEVVIPAKIGMPTHRTMMIKEDENEVELRLNIDLLQERREAAAIREAKYKTKME